MIPRYMSRSLTPFALPKGKLRGPQDFEKETEQSKGVQTSLTQPLWTLLCGQCLSILPNQNKPPRSQRTFCPNSNLNNDFPGIKNQ